MLGLAAGLVARGQEVVVCAPPDLRHLVEERGLEFQPLGTDIHRFLGEHADALRRGPVVAMWLAKKLFGRFLKEQFEALPRAAAGASDSRSS